MKRYAVMVALKVQHSDIDSLLLESSLIFHYQSSKGDEIC